MLFLFLHLLLFFSDYGSEIELADLTLYVNEEINLIKVQLKLEVNFKISFKNFKVLYSHFKSF